MAVSLSSIVKLYLYLLNQNSISSSEHTNILKIGMPCIHILGLGSMGTLLAVELLKHTEASIIPIFRSKEKQENFERVGKSVIGLRKLFLEGLPLTEFMINHSSCPEDFSSSSIKNLVITAKTYQTKSAIEPYLTFINNDTNLILIQNGLGVLEQLKEEVFINESTRPNLFQGVISHGVYHDKGFIYNHAGWVGMKIARLPWGNKEEDPIQSRNLIAQDRSNNELMKLLTSEPFAKSFGIQHLTYQELLLGQLHKFLLNSCMNTVTAIADCVNGEMANHCEDIFRLILNESLDILRVAYKPLFEYETKYRTLEEKFSVLNVDSVLNTNRLVKEIIQVGCIACAKNSTSMRQDTLNLRDTEIAYINGYLVDLACKLGLGDKASKVNQTIVAFVNLRSGLNRTRAMDGDKR